MNEGEIGMLLAIKYGKVIGMAERGREEDALQKAMPVNLKEMREIVKDPNFINEPLLVELDLSLHEEQTIIGKRLVTMYHSASTLERMAQSLGVHITQKDRKGGLKKITSRILNQMERPDVLNKYRTSIYINFVSSASKEATKKLDCTTPEQWREIKHTLMQDFLDAKSLINVVKQEVKGWTDKFEAGEIDQLELEQRETEEWVTYENTVLNAAMIALSFFDEEVFDYYRQWMINDPGAERNSYDLALADTIQTWLDTLEEKSSSISGTEEIERVKRQQQEDAAQFTADLAAMQEIMSQTIFSMQEKSRKQMQGEVVQVARPILEGKKVLVIGDSPRREAYRQLVELAGGEFDFVDGFGKNAQAIERFGWAEGILLVTAYVEHAKWYALKARVDMDKLVMVNRAGIAAVNEGIQDLANKLGVEEKLVVGK